MDGQDVDEGMHPHEVGKTCRSCYHWKRECKELIGKRSGATECHWDPPRFTE